MKQIKVDLAIIGGGPAGLAAAKKAKELGIETVMIIERDNCMGGILNQCIHDGFGIHRFNSRLSGSQYAQRFIDDLSKTDVIYKFNTMVLEINQDKILYACNEKDGMMKITCGAIILAMGCRERTASQILLHGYRPSGVLTAGTVQRYINIDGYLPGKKAVILGSGDIGLIMARRMMLEGMEVEGVYEVMKDPGGLTRNIVQCLDDYNIDLCTSTTVTWIHGKEKLKGVTVAKIDSERNVIEGTERFISCDLLVLAVGLIPENELSVQAGIEMDPKTKGPVLDNHFMTSIPGIFAAGNVSVVFDLVDYVSISGEIAAQGACDYLKDNNDTKYEYNPIKTDGNINFIIPQRIRIDEEDQKTRFFMRVKEKQGKSNINCYSGEDVINHKVAIHVNPPEMLSYEIDINTHDNISIQIKEM